MEENEQTQNKTIIQDKSQQSNESKLEKTHVLPREITQINFKPKTLSQSQQIIDRAEIIQNKMYEVANNLKETLQTNMEALVKEIFYLDQNYKITTFTSDQHPNYVATHCLDNAIKLNEQLEKSIVHLKSMSGNSKVIQFISGFQIIELEQFKEIQNTQFYPSQEYFIESDDDSDQEQDQDQDQYQSKPVNVFQWSPNNMFLTCCQYSKQTTITIWNIKETKVVKQIKYKGQITTLIYYNDSNRFITGDEAGNLGLFDSQTEQIMPELQYQIHQASICQFKFKINDQVYSCSLDSKIKLTDILKKEILLVINNDVSCFSGFDYSSKEGFLIAPNKSGFVTLWDNTSGIEINRTQTEIQEQKFIAICLSQNSEQVLVNFYEQQKILLIQIINNFRQLQVIKQMNLEDKCYNLSWCLNDLAFLYISLYGMRVRFLGFRTMPLIKLSGLPNENVKNQKPYVNQQNPQLESLIIPQGRNVYLINRKKFQKQTTDQK